jgi:hypothetical protein
MSSMYERLHAHTDSQCTHSLHTNSTCILILSALIRCILIQRAASVACMSACMRILILSARIRCKLLASILHDIQKFRQPLGPLWTRPTSWILFFRSQMP